MKYFKLFILLLFFLSCSSKDVSLTNNLAGVRSNNQGALITIDLITNNKIRRGKTCQLVVRVNSTNYRLTLKEGKATYAMPVPSGKASIMKISCGPFYFYEIGDEIEPTMLAAGKITYLGYIEFELQDKGNLTWGNGITAIPLLRANIDDLGIPNESLEIKPLVY